MHKWNIYLNISPTNSKELNNLVMKKFCMSTQGKQLGRNKKSYVEKFNLNCDLQQQEYIEIAQLTTNYH